MISHVMIGSNDIEKSKSFYSAVLKVLGAGAPMEHKNDTGQTRLFYMHDGSMFSISEPINGKPVTTANGSTIGFACNSPEQVKEFHDVAVANGGISVEDPPGPRNSTMGVMHLCYFLDPDGHKICGIHRAG
ncbi:MAG: VOC family protein [Haliea sp.]|jgi:catechol 2,3-dioxygenase-like lactoylglutathione lyase family enzyme|nr:VOC family protein [Haliea sp.]MDP5064227.1 VOC family protein [Haliea sp.]